MTDFVFGPICSTRKVYEEGARDVALSALSGINGKELIFTFKFWFSIYFTCLDILHSPTATIFAYGQTSSGKTFTMRGITENVVKDIYEHIKNVSY